MDDLALNDRMELLCLAAAAAATNFDVVAVAEELAVFPLLPLEFRNLIHGDDADRILIVRASFWESMVFIVVFNAIG